MSDPGRCPLYRDAASLNVGRGLGYCDLEGGHAICEGDVQYCNKPDDLRKRLLEQKEKETRKDQEEGPPEKKPFQYKILVVDDEEEMRKLIATLLSRQGHQCITAGDGAEALDKLCQTRFDAVITDIVMPKKDGIALTKEALSLYPKLPIMVMTAFAKAYSPESVIEAGARDFIEKPFSVEEFILRFDKMMHDHGVLLQMQDKMMKIYFMYKGLKAEASGGAKPRV